MPDTILEDLGLRAETMPAHLVTATVKTANHDAAVMTFTYNNKTHQGILPAGEQTRETYWRKGDKHPVVILTPPTNKRRALLSVIHPHIVHQNLAALVPEIRNGDIKIVGVARAPGYRTKIAVAATKEGIDPISCVVGRKSNRVRALKEILGGEQVDIISWHPDPETFIRNALQPATVEDVTFNPEDRYLVTVTVPNHQMSAAVGNRGLNSALAGRLTQHRIVVEAL